MKKEDQRRARTNKEAQSARKGRKSRNTVFFPMFYGSGGLQSIGSIKRPAEPSGRMRDQKLHAAVARSTFRSQIVKSTSALEHFWKLSPAKSARGCGTKHISKSNCKKHYSFGTLLEVEPCKKRTRLWHEAHFEVKL